MLSHFASYLSNLTNEILFDVSYFLIISIEPYLLTSSTAGGITH